MMSLVTIDSVELIRVTGGAGQPPQQPPQASGGDQQAAAAPSLQDMFGQLIALFQDPRFQSFLSGLNQMAAAFQPPQPTQSASAAPSGGDQGQQQAAA